MFAPPRRLWNAAQMKILVTGSLGFVGNRLIPHLESAGHAVTGFDRDTVDVSDPEAVSAFVRASAPEAVIHLAAIAFVPSAARDPNLAHRVNVEGTRNIIEAVRAHVPEARLLLIGSGDQYPPQAPGDPPLSEERALAPLGVYAETKAVAEELGHAAARAGMDVVRIRAFNHTGPGQSPNFVAPDFARQIARIEAGDRAPMRVGNLDSVRDFLHVDDVIEAYRHLIDPEVPNGVYNVSSGVGIRIGEILAALASRAGVEPEILRDEARWRPADARVGNCHRLQEVTGWKPLRTLDQTLEAVLDDWRARIREPGA
ncbi:MAG: GDP-mannose 4,6-dehydratase [Myxococcota bacterium]|nr:GDP-mannose 4,6-dehydratase [Myxococcota bacterium]